MSLAKLQQECDTHSDDYVALDAQDLLEALKESTHPAAVELRKIVEPAAKSAAQQGRKRKISIHRTHHAAKLLTVSKPTATAPAVSPVASAAEAPAAPTEAPKET